MAHNLPLNQALYMPPDGHFVNGPRTKPALYPVYIFTFKIKCSKNADAGAHFILTIIRRIQSCCANGLHPLNVLLHPWCAVCSVLPAFNAVSTVCFCVCHRVNPQTDGRRQAQCRCVELSWMLFTLESTIPILFFSLLYSV